MSTETPDVEIVAPSPKESLSSNTVPVQLIPYVEAKDVRPGFFEVVERRLRDGEMAGIGRLSARNPIGDPNYMSVKARVVSRVHAALIARNGQVYLKDIGSSSGTYINETRLSPSLKESEEFLLHDGDIICFGTEFKDKMDLLPRRVSFKFVYYDQTWIAQQKRDVDSDMYLLLA